MWVGGCSPLGVIVFDEPLTPTRLACIALILAGVVGLRLADAD